MRFGQLVTGSPGSGKTTYCKAAADFLRAQGRRLPLMHASSSMMLVAVVLPIIDNPASPPSAGREICVVNLDPADDNPPYDCSIDMKDIASVSEKQREHQLGPNGALMLCIEQLETRSSWLLHQLSLLNNAYVLFDCPGQVFLFLIFSFPLL
jgi:GTPase SAR1 family protein